MSENIHDKYNTVSENLIPNGGVPGKYYTFYTGYGTPVTEENVLAFGKEHNMSKVYWATDSAMYNGLYNGDTYVLYENADDLPENYKKDAIDAERIKDLKSNSKQYYRFNSVEEAKEFNSKKHMHFVQESADDSVYVFDNVYDLPEKERASVLEKIWASQKTSGTLDIESISDDEMSF